jgi:hypothetical protein
LFLFACFFYSILNKITLGNFDNVSEQLIDVGITSVEILEGIITRILQCAIASPSSLPCTPRCVARSLTPTNSLISPLRGRVTNLSLSNVSCKALTIEQEHKEGLTPKEICELEERK